MIQHSSRDMQPTVSDGMSSGSVRTVQVNSAWLNFIQKRLPIFKWLPHYTLSIFFQDLLAGFTVGLTEIPQGIAFAAIASLPLEYGLYCGFMGGFGYALFGTCKDVNIGPTSIMALMIQPHVAKMGNDMGIIITFLSGVLIFVLGLLHLGFVVEFFSYPIIAGFTCAAALQIASTQIKGLFGIPGKADAFLDAWIVVFDHLHEIRLWDTVLGISSIVFLVGIKEIRRYGTLKYRNDWSRNRNIFGILLFMLSLARNAIIVIIGTTIAYSFKDSKDPPFRITGHVNAGFPPFEPPPFSTNVNGTQYDFIDMAKNYNTGLLFIPLVAILEAIAIAKAFSKGKTLNASQEMIALGICNIMGSFVRSMPVTGSFTRTAVNNASGVRTPLAGIFTSFMVLLAIAFLTPTFYYVPKATLSSVVICAMFYLFEFEAFGLLWRTKKLDLIPFLVTLLCCIFIGLEYGIIIGIGVNLLFILYSSARPKIAIIKDKLGDYQTDVYMITPKDTLFFPAAEYLRDIVLGCEEPNSIVIINGKYVVDIDVTVAKIMAMLVDELPLKDQKIIFLDFKQSIVDVCGGVDSKILPHFKTGDLNGLINDLEVQT